MFRKRQKIRKNKAPTSTLVRNPTGFTDKFRTILQYNDQMNLAPSANAGQYTYRGNSGFDPDYTSAGHQPRYFDQLAAVYSRYRVFSSTIEVSVINYAGLYSTEVVVIPNTEVVAIPNPGYAKEMPYARTTGLNSIAGTLPSKVKHKMSTSKILGLENREILDLDYSALTNANPVSIWYWMIYAYALPTSEDVNVLLAIKITMDIEFYDRIEIAQSFVVKEPEAKTPEERAQLIPSPFPSKVKVEKRVSLSTPSSKFVS